MANEAKLVITGDSSGAVSAVSRLNTELGALQSLAAKALAFGGIAGLAGVASHFVEITKGVIDTGDALNKMSQKTGISVEGLSKLKYAADLSGVSSEALQKGLTSLAVKMIEAGTAVGPTAEEFKKLGISVRNSDGTMKKSSDVLGELADKFQGMPDGVEKTNLAVQFFGKKMGAEMIPLLNGGKAGLKAMGDEAERLGLVMSTELAKKSEEFKDNLERLKKGSEALGITIANRLIPALNEYAVTLLAAKKAGVGFGEGLGIASMAAAGVDPAKQIAQITDQLEKMTRKRDAWQAKFGGESLFGNNDKEIAALQAKLAAWKEIQDKQTGDGVQSAEELATKRVAIEQQMQAKLAQLAQLRGVAEGTISSEILLSDTARTEAQIKNAEKLRDALRTAWQSSMQEATAAGEAAKKLFEQAASTRQTSSEKATDKLRSKLSPEDQQAQIQSEFRNVADSAESAALQAKLANMMGRTENAAKLADQARKDADRASALADKITDPDAAAKAITQAGEIQATLLEAQGKGKQQEQKTAEERAAAQAALIAGLDKQITELQTKAAALKVEVNISEAQGALVTLQAQLAALQDKTITVTVNQVGATPLGLSKEEGAKRDLALWESLHPGETWTGAGPNGFARGGYTGPGGKWQPAGIVHAGEFVHRQEVVRQPGALEFLSRFNQIGMASLKLRGYSIGGLVSNLDMPSLAPSPAVGAGNNATFVLPGMGSFPVQVAPDVMGELKTAFSREALKRGGRR